MDQSAVLDILASFRDALESAHIRVEKLILFGSYATATAHEDSDIDVVIISPDFSDKGYWERIDILTDAIYNVNAPIEASAFTPQEWQSGQSLLVDYTNNNSLAV